MSRVERIRCASRKLSRRIGWRLSQAALEGLALEGYRQGTLTQLHVGRLLGLSRIQTEDFLAEHLALYDCEPAELRREAEALARLSDGPRLRLGSHKRLSLMTSNYRFPGHGYGQ